MRNSIFRFPIVPLALVFPMAALAQLSIMPTSQSVPNAGDAASYTVTVHNPTGTTQTFVPSTSGIPGSWGVQLPASVTVTSGVASPSISCLRLRSIRRAPRILSW
jgi:hypothetical protein